MGSNFDTMSRKTTSQSAASKALPTDLVPQKSSRSLGVFKEQDHRTATTKKTRAFIGPDFFPTDKKKEPNFAMKLALGLDVQTNAKGGKFMSIEDSHQGALVCKVDVEVLWEPGNFQDDGAKRVGVCFASNQPGAVDGGGGVDNMIIFQKPFPGAARTSLRATPSR